MKKIILTGVSCLFLVLGIVSCSSEETTNFQENQQELTNKKKSNQLYLSEDWYGEIGEEKDGEIIITANDQVLLSDFEGLLKDSGIYEYLSDIQIVKKVSIANPIDEAYMLIASNVGGTSIGVFLDRNVSNGRSSFFIAKPSSGAGAGSISCTGCASGCNLSYLNIDGKSVAYCNENGCVYDCTEKTL